MPHPSRKTPELVTEVLERVSTGEPLAVVLREPDKVHYTAWYEWVRSDESLALAYARARAAGLDQIVQRLRETARGGGESTGDVQRDKLIVETDLKLLKCWDPKRYGDRVVAAGDPEAPIVVQNDSAALAQELVGLLRDLSVPRDEPDE